MDVRGARRTNLSGRAWRVGAMVAALSLPVVAVAQDTMGPTAVPLTNAATSSVTGAVANVDRRTPVQESKPLGGAPAGSPTATDPNAQSSGSSSHMLQTVLTLGIVIGVILLVGAGVRKLARAKGGLLAELGAGGKAPAGVLEVLGRYPISRSSMLVLLKLDRRILLTCQTQGRRGTATGMSMLCEITDPEEVASILLKTREEEGDSLAKKFEAMLAKEDSWPATGDVSEDPVAAQPRLVAPDDDVDREPAEVVVRSRADRPLVAASSGLRSRMDSIGAARQPLAKGGRA